LDSKFRRDDAREEEDRQLIWMKLRDGISITKSSGWPGRARKEKPPRAAQRVVGDLDDATSVPAAYRAVESTTTL
jgi:hypothetical protein